MGKEEMFSRQDAKNAKESMALFRPMTVRGELWVMDADRVLDKEVDPGAVFIQQIGADLLMDP